MNFKIILSLLIFTAWATFGKAQGPPITADKPIMLSEGSMLVKTLTEVRKTNFGSFTRAPLMFHYIFSRKVIAAVHVPYVHYNFTDGSPLGTGSTLGDIQFMAKYQFYRKDRNRRTLRAVVKTVQTLPTGENIGLEHISGGRYQSYQGIVMGYEAMQYGISNEIGFGIIDDSNRDFFTYRVGFGLPLLKQVYPVNQLNLYFEYHNNWYTEADEYELHYAQGIQYARDQVTLDFAVLIPLVQDIALREQRDYSILFGARYVF